MHVPKNANDSWDIIHHSDQNVAFNYFIVAIEVNRASDISRGRGAANFK